MREFYILVGATLLSNTLLLAFLAWAYRSPRFEGRRIELGAPMKVSKAARLKNMTTSAVLSLAVVLGSTYFLYEALFTEAHLTQLVETLRATWIGGLNEFLRSRSKLYLLLKNELTDPRKRYFFADHANYVVAAERDTDGGRFAAGIAPKTMVCAPIR